MKLSDLVNSIVYGDKLSHKLISFDKVEFDEFDFSIPDRPARSEKTQFSAKQLKFPKGNFQLENKKNQALNSFANHELLATEMMACALGIFPHKTEEQKRFKRGIINALIDEQKHFELYRNRMNDLGADFGDFPLNDFFWRQMKHMQTPQSYIAVMSLTFEAANLDFASYYAEVFKSVDDDKTADVLNTVLEDEIGHVAFGVSYLRKWREDKSIWQYYNECLPEFLTPARSKGKYFNQEARKKAKMDEAFISKLLEYKDDFSITKRKEWK